MNGVVGQFNQKFILDYKYAERSTNSLTLYNYNALWRREREICSIADPFDLRCKSVTFLLIATYIS